MSCGCLYLEKKEKKKKKRKVRQGWLFSICSEKNNHNFPTIEFVTLQFGGQRRPVNTIRRSNPCHCTKSAPKPFSSPSPSTTVRLIQWGKTFEAESITESFFLLLLHRLSVRIRVDPGRKKKKNGFEE